jgi:hypothetical protein
MKHITIAALLWLTVVGCARREDWTPKNLRRTPPAAAAAASAPVAVTPLPAKQQRTNHR